MKTLLWVEFVPRKDMLTSQPHVPVTVTLFGNRVFADVTKLNKVTVDARSGVLLRRGGADTQGDSTRQQGQRRESCVY